jgi:hypothetical protein
MKSACFEAAQTRAAAVGAPGEHCGEAAVSCPCRCAEHWPWRWCSRRRLFALLRRPARETSQSDENEYYNTENREQAHVGVSLLACRHRPLADIMRPGFIYGELPNL